MARTRATLCGSRCDKRDTVRTTHSTSYPVYLTRTCAPLPPVIVPLEFSKQDDSDKLSTLDRKVAEVCEAAFSQFTFKEDATLESLFSEVLEDYMEQKDELHEVMGPGDTAPKIMSEVGAKYVSTSLLLRRYAVTQRGRTDPLGRLIQDGTGKSFDVVSSYAFRKDADARVSVEGTIGSHPGQSPHSTTPGDRPPPLEHRPSKATFLQKLRRKVDELEQRRRERLVREGEERKQGEMEDARRPSDFFEEEDPMQEMHVGTRAAHEAKKGKRWGKSARRRAGKNSKPAAPPKAAVSGAKGGPEPHPHPVMPVVRLSMGGGPGTAPSGPIGIFSGFGKVHPDPAGGSGALPVSRTSQGPATTHLPTSMLPEALVRSRGPSPSREPTAGQEGGAAVAAGHAQHDQQRLQSRDQA